MAPPVPLVDMLVLRCELVARVECIEPASGGAFAGMCVGRLAGGARSWTGSEESESEEEGLEAAGLRGLERRSDQVMAEMGLRGSSMRGRGGFLSGPGNIF